MIRLSCIHAWSNRHRSSKNAVRLNSNDEDQERVSPIILLITVVIYLIFGAIVMPLLNGHFDFVNGLCKFLNAMKIDN